MLTKRRFGVSPSTLPCALAIRPSELKAILDARGVDYTGVIEKEVLEQKVRDSETTAKKAKTAMKRPSRAAAVASSKAWKDNIKSYNNNRFGDSGDEDDYEDEGPSAAARSKKAKANGGTKKRKRPKDNSDDDFSDNFSAASESEDPGSESEAQASESEDSEEDFDSDEFDSEDDERRQRGEAEPPADTRPEAAAAAAIAALKQRRKDLKGKMIKAQVRAEAIEAAQKAHAACLKSKGRRASRESSSSSHEVTAYYHAEDAAKKVLRAAYPKVEKAPARKKRFVPPADEAEIEKERRKNIARNHDVLVGLGLA